MDSVFDCVHQAIEGGAGQIEIANACRIHWSHLTAFYNAGIRGKCTTMSCEMVLGGLVPFLQRHNYKLTGLGTSTEQIQIGFRLNHQDDDQVKNITFDKSRAVTLRYLLNAAVECGVLELNPDSIDMGIESVVFKTSQGWISASLDLAYAFNGYCVGIVCVKPNPPDSCIIF